MEDLDLYKDRLTASLQLLMLPFSEQERYFEDFVDKPFEVLDTFDNAFLHFPKLIERGDYDNKVIASILRLHNLINFTSSNPKFKDLEDEQFRKSEEWNRIREMAKETLKLIGEPEGKPNLKYL